MRKSKGFTLVELLVGLSVATAVLGTVAAVFVPSLTTYRNNQALSSIQENERYLVNTFSTSINQAGFSGCDSREPGLIVNAVDLPTNAWIQAFNAPVVITAAGSQAQPNGYLSTAAETLRPSATTGTFPAGDVLTLLTTGVSNFSLSAHISANQTVAFRGDASELSQKLITLGDCNATALFQVGAGTVTTTGGVTTTTFSYAEANTANCAAGGVTPAQVFLGGSEQANCNSATNRNEFTAYDFSPGATAAEVVATSFFIGTPADGIPSIYSVSASTSAATGFTDPTRLVSGVDNMRVRYGLRNAAGTGVDYFTAPTFVGSVADVVTVEVSFILNSGVSISVRGNADEVQEFNFLALDNDPLGVDCDGTQTSDNDLSACPVYMTDSGITSGQLRRTFTKVFNIRNIQ